MLRKRVWRAWFYGGGSALAITSLLQDWYGQERYIELCRTSWTDGVYMVPIAVIILALCISGTQGLAKPPEDKNG